MGSESNVDLAESSDNESWLRWTKQSNKMLCNVEKEILSYVKTPYKGFYVDIGSVVGKNDKIWTISLNDESKKTPLVMLHGLGAGLALWCPNLDTLADTRPVYAIDLLGFARSSRPKFSPDAAKAEAQWVESIEEWRRGVNLDEFILLGHSLGGYLSTAYTIKYPNRVRHLILADPWGFPDKPENVYEKFDFPLWMKVVTKMAQPLNPLWVIRAAGPAGRWLVGKARADLSRKYLKYIPDAETLVSEYIYQCNSQTPSGESAFHTLMDNYAWAKNPMVHRLDKLNRNLPVTVLYGSLSRIDNSSGKVITQQRNSNKTYVQVINGASHHIYLDKVDIFNEYVLGACSRSDEVVSDVKRSDDNTKTDDKTNQETRSDNKARFGDKTADTEKSSATVEPTTLKLHNFQFNSTQFNLFNQTTRI